ncbi:hypothetical protein Hdeb2414_s0001g00022351 [Helianthus debilis subsp. tardiflorus]
MNPSSEIYKFTNPDIDSLLPCFPSKTIFWSFDPSVRSDAISPVWVCFPALPFLLDYSYPFPDLTQWFFTLIRISYSLAMSMLLRVRYIVEEIIKAEDLDFNLS